MIHRTIKAYSSPPGTYLGTEHIYLSETNKKSHSIYMWGAGEGEHSKPGRNLPNREIIK